MTIVRLGLGLGFAIHGSVLISSAEFCVICGNFGFDEAQIEKESRHAQFETRRESCP
jgi:hypothetical protein